MAKLDISDAFELAHGLPRADWKRLRERICEASGRETPRHLDWCNVERYWLKLIAATIGRNFSVIESDRFMLLVPAADDKMWMLDILEESQNKVVDNLGERPGGAIIGKTAILAYNDPHLYGQHVRHYRHDGLMGESAGCCINSMGHIHIALSALGGIRTIVPHELVHAYLGSLRLPTWVDEGVAQIVARRWKYDFTTQVASQVRLFWRNRGLDRLWTGEAFAEARAGEEMLCAYIFSELLVKEIRAAGEAEFRQFLSAAHFGDAGEAACRAVYGFGLQGWAERLVGAGDWSPKLEDVDDDAAAPERLD